MDVTEDAYKRDYEKIIRSVSKEPLIKRKMAMVKFAFIKEVELEDPSKCGGCIFQDFTESGASMGSSYCNATEEGFLINTPGRPDWCPLILNYKEALRTAGAMLDDVLEAISARKRGDCFAFSTMIRKELGCKREERR